jgi:hypothetical protein
MFRKLNLSVGVVIWACSPSAEAASVSGQFVLGGKPLAPAEVAAFRMRDQFNPRELETYVMLTTRPVNKDKIKDAIDPYAVAINDPAAFGDGVDYIALSIHADGKTSLNAHVGGVQYVDSSGTIMGQQGSLSAACKENTATRIACTVKTTKEVKPMNGPAWTLDVSFDAEVLSRPAGKPMSKDGEAPGKALVALRAAVAGDDLTKILALLAPDKAKSYNEDYNTPAENLKSIREILDARLPKQPKITGGEWLADDHALLEVEGMPFASTRMLYLVEMRRIDGVWLWEDSSPAGMLP